MASLCDRFKCLPEPGGVFEQNPNSMNKIMLALKALDKIEQEDMEREARKKD